MLCTHYTVMSHLKCIHNQTFLSVMLENILCQRVTFCFNMKSIRGNSSLDMNFLKWLPSVPQCIKVCGNFPTETPFPIILNNWQQNHYGNQNILFYTTPHRNIFKAGQNIILIPNLVLCCIHQQSFVLFSQENSLFSSFYQCRNKTMDLLKHK